MERTRALVAEQLGVTLRGGNMNGFVREQARSCRVSFIAAAEVYRFRGFPEVGSPTGKPRGNRTKGQLLPFALGKPFARGERKDRTPFRGRRTPRSAVMRPRVPVPGLPDKRINNQIVPTSEPL